MHNLSCATSDCASNFSQTSCPLSPWVGYVAQDLSPFQHNDTQFVSHVIGPSSPLSATAPHHANLNNSKMTAHVLRINVKHFSLKQVEQRPTAQDVPHPLVSQQLDRHPQIGVDIAKGPNVLHQSLHILRPDRCQHICQPNSRQALTA